MNGPENKNKKLSKNAGWETQRFQVDMIAQITISLLKNIL